MTWISFMLLHIPQLIDQQQLDVILPAISGASFVDGKLSAGINAQQVKNNTEVAQDSEIGQNLAKILIGNLYNNPQFRDAAFPYRIATPIFAKYEQGKSYGLHIDDPIMGGDAQKFRCDIAMTVFLSQRKDYEGGELCIQTQFGEQQCKFDAGDLVLYPASSLHRVNEITSGTRIVGISWVQSMIREPAKREILYDLSRARDNLTHNKELNKTKDLVEHSFNNLVRMWSEV